MPRWKVIFIRKFINNTKIIRELISIENINNTINYGKSKFLYIHYSKKLLNLDELFSRPNDKEAEIMYKLIDNEINIEEFE